MGPACTAASVASASGPPWPCQKQVVAGLARTCATDKNYIAGPTFAGLNNRNPTNAAGIPRSRSQVARSEVEKLPWATLDRSTHQQHLTADVDARQQMPLV